MARAVVGIADHLVADGYATHARADLLDHAGEVRALAAGKGRREDLADQTLTQRRLTGIDASGADRHEHLVGPGLRTRHVAHVEDLYATVIVESDCLHQPVTYFSGSGWVVARLAARQVSRHRSILMISGVPQQFDRALGQARVGHPR